MSALPTLTQNISAVQTTGSLTPTADQVWAALNTLISASTYGWRVISTGSGYIQIGGPIGGALEDFRIIFGGADPGAGAYLAPDTAGNALWFGIAPDGGTFAAWNQANPYTSARWKGYWRCAPTALIENIYIVESAEELAVVFIDTSAGNSYMCGAGAIFKPMDNNPTLGSAVEADGRIYGMYTTGSNSASLSTTFWGASNLLLAHSGTANSAHIGAFRPNQPTTFDTLTRVQETFATVGMRDADGKLKNLEVDYYSPAGGIYIGSLRQMYFSENFSDRQSLATSGVEKAVCVAKSQSPATSHPVVFGNS